MNDQIAVGTPHRAVIIGAGVAGLSMALRLRRSGWQVVVVEKSAAPRGGGYLIAFLGVGYSAAERLGLLDALRRAEPPSAELVFVGEDGEPHAVVPADVHRAVRGDRSVVLLRGDLEAALHAALEDTVEFRFGVSVEEISQEADGAVVRLTDGSREEADLVVGADGVHSHVRELVFGREEDHLVDLGHTVATYVRDEPAVPDTMTQMNLVGRTVGIHGLPAGRSAAVFYFRDDEKEADRSGTLHRVYGDLGWQVPELLKGFDAADDVYYDRMCQIKMDHWSRGRVVLVGDSAWCVSLLAGYGASLAVHGAAALGDELDASPHDVFGALARWERSLRKEVARRQRRAVVGLLVAPSTTALRVRRLMLRVSTSRPVMACIRRMKRRSMRSATALPGSDGA